MARLKKQGKKKTLAQYADRHDLYQRAVQCVEAEIDFVDATYLKLRGKRAAVLREDFCGTANTSCEWVRRRAGTIAVGVDLDTKTLAWGKEHNLSKLTEAERARITLHRGDVLRAGPTTGRGLGARGGRRGAGAGGVGRAATGFDVVLAMNFSYWHFKQREMLVRYYKRVRASLARDGVFFMDCYGGSDAHREIEETRQIPARQGGGYGSTPFTYVWEQARYDPISGDSLCHIHFKFGDGSEMRRAFTYDWRLWTIPEIREVLAEAGFSRSTVYWEGDDGKGGGDGVFRPAKRGEACPAYICYIVAER